MKTDKKLIIFIVVFILLIASIIYRVMNPFVHKTIDTLTYTGNRFDKSANGRVVKVRDLKEKSTSLVQQFLNKPKVSNTVFKDLFSIYSPESNKIVGKRKLAQKNNKGILNKKTDQEDQTNSITKIREYITSYKWYGVYKSQGERAVFLAKDKMILVAKPGDRIDGKYQIEDVQDMYLKIKVLDQNQVLHLGIREFEDE